MNQRNFTLVVSTPELETTVYSETIKRDLINAIPWMHDYCKNKDLIRTENLSNETRAILLYFRRCMIEEKKSIHDYAGCRLKYCNNYTTEVEFLAYNLGVEEIYEDDI